MRAPVLLAVLAALLAPATAQTASFELLPPSDYSNVEAVSPNGDAVLLWRSASDLREAVWHDGGLTPVGAPQCGPFDSYRAFAVSDDGIDWSEPVQAITALSIVFPHQPVAWHPTLILDDDDGTEGWLVYSYTPRWHHEHLGGTPHYMVGHRIKLTPRD